MPADRNFEMAHAGEWLSVQRHFIEREGFPAPLISAHHAHNHVGALLNRPAIGENLLESLIKITQIGLREKAEMASVDRQNWHSNGCRLTRSRQHRAVSSQHNRQHHRGIKPLGHTSVVPQHAQVLIWVGKTHHPSRTAGPHHLMASELQPLLNRLSGLYGERLSVIHDQSDPGHRSRFKTTASLYEKNRLPAASGCFLKPTPGHHQPCLAFDPQPEVSPSDAKRHFFPRGCHWSGMGWMGCRQIPLPGRGSRDLDRRDERSNGQHAAHHSKRQTI